MKTELLQYKTLPKYTICIPSRDRIRTLSECLDSLGALERDDLEVIVSLNGYNAAEADKLMTAFIDRSISFIQPPALLSMPENYEFVVQHATGQYVTIIGDDDTLVADALDIADQHFNKYPTTILSWFRWPYYWRCSKSLPGTIFIHGRQDPYEIRTSELSSTFGLAFPDYQLCPSLYNSFFPRSIINELLKLNSGFLWPPKIVVSPDVFNAFQTLSLIRSYYYSRYPLSLSGISGRSSGMSDSSDESSEIARFAHELGKPRVADLVDKRFVPSESILLSMATDLLRVADQRSTTGNGLFRSFGHRRVAKLAFLRYMTRDRISEPQYAKDFYELAKRYNLNYFTEKQTIAVASLDYLSIAFQANCRVWRAPVEEVGIKSLCDVAKIYPSLSAVHR